MIPKIDYELLGRGLTEYKKRGYQYVEAPWFVSESAIRATLPEPFEPLRMGLIGGEFNDCLVGSAEQGLIGMGLPAGSYVAVTPCFRDEEKCDLYTQYTFMKIELFIVPKGMPSAEGLVARLFTDASDVMCALGGRMPAVRETDEGHDLEINGIEVGSYGVRSAEGYGRWAYGTGLALPRFSVANAFASIL